MIGHILQLGHGDTYQFLIHLLIGLEGNEEHEGLFRTEGEIAVDAHTVGATFVFADLLGVDDVHDVAKDLHLHLILHGVCHLTVVNHITGDHWILHGLGVVAVDVLVGNGGHIGRPSLVVFLGLQ